jgi:hypothetical protein
MNFEQNIVFQVLGNNNKNIHYESQLLQQDTELDIPENSDLVLLNHSFGNNHTIQQYELLKQKVGNKDFVLLTSNYYYWQNKHPNIIYFPYYYFYFLSLSNSVYDIKNHRPYQLMCFNLNPWVHRTKNLLKLSKKNWFNHCKLSFHWTYKTDKSDTTAIGLNTLSQLTQLEKTELEKFNFPIVVEDNWVLGGNFYVSNKSELYGQVMINYVTENTVQQEFITEKIWKPIFSGQLFYVLGSKNYIQHLRDIGVDVFDDIINHEYDNTDNLDCKIDLILADLDKLMISDLENIWNETYMRRKNNLDLLSSQEFSRLLSNDLIKRVS